MRSVQWDSMKGELRRRSFVWASAVYVLLGVIILVRAIVAHTYPLIVLALIFVALGLVRLRDYRSWRNRTS